MSRDEVTSILLAAIIGCSLFSAWATIRLLAESEDMGEPELRLVKP